MTKQTAAYGSWRSPITAELLTAATVGLSEPQFDHDDIYWLESRPLERGRNTIVKLGADGTGEDVLPKPLNARSRVNEYGGGSYCVSNGVLYFVQFDDQRVYRLNLHASSPSQLPAPQAITPDAAWRFGNLIADDKRRRLLAVCEDHHDASREEETFLAAIALEGDPEQPPRKLLDGRDFYSSPAISPDGKHIAWLCWDHPNMPWDGCECWLGSFDNSGEITDQQLVAGGDGESIFQPQWSPDGRLFLVSDRSNWWNIYRWEQEQLVPVCERAAEFGAPQWVFGQSTYGFLDPDTLLATYTESGHWFLCTIDLRTGRMQELPSDLSDIGYVRAQNGQALFIGASPTRFPALFGSEGKQREIRSLVESASLSLEAEAIAPPETIEFPLGNHEGRGHAFFYPPRNQDYQGEPGSKPPLLVLCHGGPTSATRATLNLKIQYWTSRGFAVVDVNYGGSTGFGRLYRERLNGQWGIVDVQDAVDCVKLLAAQDRIDADKVAIRGSSAGGYTVLAALTFHQVFRAGASLYGVGDLETLAGDTHKFESRYLDNLVGPYPAGKAEYRARSPIHHVEQLNCPVIFLQGLKDKIVPPNQAQAMVAALDARQIPVAYVTFAEEAHGFRQAANIRRALEAELYFYSRVFGFDLAEPLEPVPIRNEQQLSGNI